MPCHILLMDTISSLHSIPIIPILIIFIYALHLTYKRFNLPHLQLPCLAICPPSPILLHLQSFSLLIHSPSPISTIPSPSILLYLSLIHHPSIDVISRSSPPPPSYEASSPSRSFLPFFFLMIFILFSIFPTSPPHVSINGQNGTATTIQS